MTQPMEGAVMADLLRQPMEWAETCQLDRLEGRLVAATAAEQRAELKQGRLLAELKTDPRQLWQRCSLFRRRDGKGWKKARNWHDYIVSRRLAESGREADRLIALWERQSSNQPI